MSYYLVNVPKRMPTGPSEFEDNVLDIVVDTENDRVEFRSQDGKNVIRLDLICAAEVEATLRKLFDLEELQTALAEKRSEHLARRNAGNRSTP